MWRWREFMKSLTNIVTKMNIIFIMSCLILCMMTFNIFTCRTQITQYYTYFVFAFGLVMILLRLLSYKRYWKTKGLKFLMLFLGSAILSVLLNYSFGGLPGLIENAQGLFWMAVFFFLIYTYDIFINK